MAKYVLVEFDDDGTAAEFIKRIHRASRTKSFRIKGVFKKPTEFCQCGAIDQTQWTRVFTRGPKSGWFIHIDCGLPRGGRQAPRNIWPDLLRRRGAKDQSNSQRIGTDGSLTLTGPLEGPSDVLPNFPLGGLDD